MQKITSLRMLPLDVKHRWMFVAILFYGILVKNNIVGSSDTNDTCRQKNVLFASAIESSYPFPSEVVYNKTRMKLGFNIKPQEGNKTPACCHNEDFNCNFTIKKSHDIWILILNNETLSKHDIVLMHSPNQVFKPPSNTTSGFLLHIHQWLNTGNQNIRLSQNSFCEKIQPYDKDACKGLKETDYNLIISISSKSHHCVPCKPPGKKPGGAITLPPPHSNNGTGISMEDAAKIMNNISLLLEGMVNESTATITIGNIKGVITKLPPKNQTDIIFGITTSVDINVLEDNDSMTDFSRSVQIPSEASTMAVKRNSSFAAVLVFPGIRQDDPKSFFLNNEVMGIEMGTEISNLSHTIVIHYRNEDKNGNIASCRSWDGKGKKAIWITDGCKTKETNGSITCQCSHLTFFAILMSPPPGNISSSDFTSLTYITSIGCGLSMFFLAVALFMYCFIRKGKASQATKILMNLFVSMFTLNLSFLVNESIANLGNFDACVAVAAVMHYTMLATISWFFIEGLHFYFTLWKLPTDIKHYMMKICITGWGTPAVVVIAFVAVRQYDYMVIHTDVGNSAKMPGLPARHHLGFCFLQLRTSAHSLLLYLHHPQLLSRFLTVHLLFQFQQDH
ncbi:adhesion G protein-coupled receptor G3-like isoform X2 [Sander vitreus]